MGSPPRAELRILIVDDDSGIRTAWRRVLARAGFEVHTSSGAMEALGALEERRYAVVITDTDMPERNGLWLLGEVRRRFPAMRRVLASGRGTADLEGYVRAGLADCFLAKPASNDELLAAVSG